jgi:hypothetical protein
MLLERAILAILAVQTLSAVASPIQPFTVQDNNFQTPLDSGAVCDVSETAQAPPTAPEVRLDDGVFVGLRKGQTDQFLGIRFALPP